MTPSCINGCVQLCKYMNYHNRLRLVHFSIASSNLYVSFGCRGMTNLGPKGERYLIPTSLKTFKGYPKLHKYNFPLSGECESGNTGTRENFVAIPGVPTAGGSMAKTGARFWLVQSATWEYRVGLSVSSHKATTIRSAMWGRPATDVVILFLVSLYKVNSDRRAFSGSGNAV